MHRQLTPVDAGVGLDPIRVGVPSMEAPPPPPPPALLVFPPLLDAFPPNDSGTAAAAGAPVGAAEAAGEVAATGAVGLLGEAPAVAFGGWALKAAARASLSGTPWESSWACADMCCCNQSCCVVVLYCRMP